MARELRGLEPLPEIEQWAWPLPRSLKAWFNRLTWKAPVRLDVTLTPAAVNGNTSAEQTFTVVGLSTDMVVVVNPPSLTAGTGFVGARISADDTLKIAWGNFTAGSLTPPSGSYRLLLGR